MIVSVGYQRNPTERDKLIEKVLTKVEDLMLDPAGTEAPSAG